MGPSDPNYKVLGSIRRVIGLRAFRGFLGLEVSGLRNLEIYLDQGLRPLEFRSRGFCGLGFRGVGVEGFRVRVVKRLECGRVELGLKGVCSCSLEV